MVRTRRSKEEFLFIVARKKPVLRDLINRLDEMSYDDIKGLQQPYWIREALASLKKHNIKTEDEIFNRFNDRITYGVIDPDKTFYVREWTGEDDFIGKSSNQMLQIQVESGEPILISPETSTIRLGSTQVTLPSNEWPKLITNSKPIGKFTRSQYFDYYQEYLNKKHNVI